MVYSSNLIVVIKNNGKVLREFQGNVVKLPFGSDYSIYLKNKDTRRKALVNVTVDGKDVLDNSQIIVDPNSATELKGFMKDSTVKNKFRFIEKTKEISSYRGDFVEDGLVEVTYRFEEYSDFRWDEPINWARPIDTKFMNGAVPRAKGSCDVASTFYSSSQELTRNVISSCVSDSGITVPGAETHQGFVTGSIGTLESMTHNIIIHLKGELVTKRNKIKAKKRIKRPITVKTKVRCSTCGRQWGSSMKYCGNCSTYLH